MLARIHCLYPQALVIVLVVATLRHLQAQRREHRAQRLGTMLWVYLFAIVLELSYSACLLGNVQCDAVTWYVTCTLLAVMGLAVIKRDDHIDAALRTLVSDEEGMERAQTSHRRTSLLAAMGAGAATAVAAVLPAVLLGSPDAISRAIPVAVAGIALPFVFMMLSRGNGLASALASIVVVAVGVVQAHVLAAGQDFSVMSDMGALASSFLRGNTLLSLTRPALASVVLCGLAVALCSVLFRLPKVVDAPEEEAPAPQEADEPAGLEEAVELEQADTTDEAAQPEQDDEPQDDKPLADPAAEEPPCDLTDEESVEEG